MTFSPRISGFGAFVPPRIVTNQDLEKIVDTTSEWILTRTGIAERHHVDQGVMASDIALEATKQALHNAGIPKELLTHVIFCTCTADANCPNASTILAHKLGIKGVVALDVNAACTGFLTGLELATALCAANPQATILVVASETLSHRCNMQDRSTCVLFGDGSGATIVQGANSEVAHPPKGLTARIIDTCLSSDGSLGDLLTIGGGLTGKTYAFGESIGPEYFIQMQGRDVFKHAVRSMSAICQQVLAKNNTTMSDVDIFIPHQANLRIIEAVGSRLEVPAEKVFINVAKYGNTSAASIPIALEDAISSHVIKAGDKVLLTSFGGGFTWGATLIQF